MDIQSFIKNNRLSIPKALLEEIFFFLQDETDKLTKLTKRAKQTGYEQYAKFLKGQYDSIKITDPEISKNWRQANGGRGIGLSSSTIERAVKGSKGSATTEIKFELLDFLCYVCNSKKSLIEVLSKGQYSDNNFLYEVELPTYAITELSRPHKTKGIPNEVPLDKLNVSQEKQHDAIAEQGDTTTSDVDKNRPTGTDTPPPPDTPPLSPDPVTQSPQLPEESFLKRYKFPIIALILVCILFGLFKSLQRESPQKLTVVDSAKITKQSPINIADSNLSDSPTVREPYKTVKINGHDWMAENLDVDSYRNGTPIMEAKNFNDWKKYAYGKEGCWCYYHFDSANGKIYGKIYNWYAVVDKAHGGIAPTGFRIPTVKEFDALLHIAGTPQYKLMATKGWASGASGTNETGFNAVPSGNISAYSDQFLNAGNKATYWTINESVAKPWTFSLSLNPNDKIFDVCSFYGGCAVRCLRATK